MNLRVLTPEMIAEAEALKARFTWEEVGQRLGCNPSSIKSACLRAKNNPSYRAFTPETLQKVLRAIEMREQGYKWDEVAEELEMTRGAITSMVSMYQNPQFSDNRGEKIRSTFPEARSYKFLYTKRLGGQL